MFNSHLAHHFKESRIPMCTCDTERVALVKALIKSGQVRSSRASGSGPIYSTVDGSFICVVDSFGFRSELPGECAECYTKYKQGYFASVEDMYD